jgi:CDP-diacylglycerol--glycerol-3-phosphate 3-phosphatidyltransferase
MHPVARWLNRVSDGKLRPSTLTFISLLAHLPIAWLIAQRHPVRGAFLLVIFGLFDALDGELARTQDRASAGGMLLDATTDRMKEVILYAGVAYLFVATGHPYASVWAVLAVGGSLLVSYVKAKGETAVAHHHNHAAINRIFQEGLMRFEIRMVLLVLGLISGHLIGAVALIAILSAWTTLDRLIRISGNLSNVQG